MSGGLPTSNEKTGLAKWLGRIPAPIAASVDTAAAARGKVIFDDPVVACAGCHNGDLLTNNTLVNVGTGGKFKVPSLLAVGARAPFMHDGCAQTLTDRFTVCGNSNLHGNTTGLTTAQIADLVEYLESL
jgi:cytochrome c peroxidase